MWLLAEFENLSYQNVSALLLGGGDLVSDVALGNLQVITGVSGIVHQGEEAIVDVKELEELIRS